MSEAEELKSELRTIIDTIDRMSGHLAMVADDNDEVKQQLLFLAIDASTFEEARTIASNPSEIVGYVSVISGKLKATKNALQTWHDRL